MNNNDAVIEFLLNQLRQQLTNNPYKQQSEDLAHEVLSLKNQLRDASALVAELQKELEYMGNEYRRAIDYALSDAPEQSGCRKNDAQECEHEWRTETLYGARVVPTYCRKCGVYKQKDEKNDAQECEHKWCTYTTTGGTVHMCRICGLKK